MMFTSRIRKAAKWFKDTFYQEPLYERLKNARFRIKQADRPKLKPTLEDYGIAVNVHDNLLYYRPPGQAIKILPIPEDLAKLFREGFNL